jgi:hypothetical protein
MHNAMARPVSQTLVPPVATLQVGRDREQCE